MIHKNFLCDSVPRPLWLTPTDMPAAPAKTIRVALVGNPNTGKSTLFTALAGVRQRVGNYPGVTVEKKTGTCGVASSISN